MTSTAHTAFRGLLSHHSLRDLERLDSALDAGQVIRGRFQAERNQSGCLMFFLSDVTSRLEMESRLDQPHIAAANLVIHYWDAGFLTREDVRDQLAQVIDQRRKLECEERINRQLVRERLAARKRRANSIQNDASDGPTLF